MLVDASTYQYCENMTGYLMTQPTNVLSNIVFWLAAYWLWHHRSRFILPIYKVILLAIGAFFVGYNSAIWHYLGTQWSLLLDISSICFYAVISMYLVFRDRLLWPRLLSFAAIMLTIASAIWFKDFMPHVFTLNSGAFIPLVIGLTGLGIYMKSGDVILAGLSLGTGLLFRVIDLASCSYIPFGTHFLWHILAGVALWLFTKTLHQKEDQV